VPTAARRRGAVSMFWEFSGLGNKIYTRVVSLSVTGIEVPEKRVTGL
jgi:hypothetical protein